eukprot:SAG22_NODE_142_length_17922_cov_10.990406_6_plen_83_part_00
MLQNRIVILNGNAEPTNDINVRKAITHAINKAAIVDQELYGLEDHVDSLFPKNAPHCDVDLTPRADYDIEKVELLRCTSCEP